MFTKSRGITVSRHSYRLVLEARPHNEMSRVKSNIIIEDVEHEDIRNVEFFTAIVQGIEDVYEKLEGGKE